MSEPLEALIRYRLDRAQESLDDARLLADAASWNTCVNRLYYSCFYAVSALLVRDGLSSSRHTGIRGLFNRHYVRTGVVPRDLARLYKDLFERRQASRPENFAFVHKSVLFIGINIVGGFVEDKAAWAQRHAENLEWTAAHLQQLRDQVSSSVILGHAFPMIHHDDYFTGLVEQAKVFVKPILYLHGDGHHWLHDYPFEAKNILRVQVEPGGEAPPIRVTITHDPASPFLIDRRKRKP